MGDIDICIESEILKVEVSIILLDILGFSLSSEER